jgi:hypothetical protein
MFIFLSGFMLMKPRSGSFRFVRQLDLSLLDLSFCFWQVTFVQKRQFAEVLPVGTARGQLALRDAHTWEVGRRAATASVV